LKPAAIYLRVSSTIQATEGTSLETQLETCRRYAQHHGYVVLKEVSDDMTGTTLERPGMQVIRDLAEAGQLSAVIVYHVDRFARDATDALVVYKELKRHNVELKSATVPIEDTPTGKLMFTLLAAIAELERTTILDRSRRGKERRAKQGHIMNSWMQPYGYRYSGPTGEGTYEIVEEEAAIVRLMFQWYTQEGLGLHGIAGRLHAMGVPTKRGGTWAAGPISKMLQNELYTGTYYWNKTGRVHAPRRRLRGQPPLTSELNKVVPKDRSVWVAVPVPPIIDQATFEAAQRQVTLNVERAGRNNKHHFYMLRSIVRCGRCGRTYMSIAKHEHYRYYTCPRRFISRRLDNPSLCDNVTYRADWLEDRVWSAIVEYLQARPAKRPAKKPALSLLHKNGSSGTSGSAMSEELKVVEATLASVERERSRMLDAYRVGAIELDALQNVMADIKRRAEAAAAERDRLGEKLSARLLSQARVEELEEKRRQLCAQIGLMDLDSPEAGHARRAVLDELEIEVKVDGLRATITGLLTHDIVLEFSHYPQRLPPEDSARHALTRQG
jgi:site-specific DNA recombinase